jgi:hypothetical protein
MKIRKLVIATHRDLGYFFAGLTVIYAISGIAVNHVADWNPNYSLETTAHQLEPMADLAPAEVAEAVAAALEIEGVPNATVPTRPGEVRVFFDQRTLIVDVEAGRVIDERAATRPGLYEANYLHLNHGKGLWTWFADLYALGLLTLALTGIFIVTGKKGLGGRGRWLLLVGTAIPLLYLILGR